MKINFFNSGHNFYSFRWLLVVFGIIMILMLYMDLAGRRMMSFSKSDQWTSQGVGSHK